MQLMHPTLCTQHPLFHPKQGDETLICYLLEKSFESRSWKGILIIIDALGN